MKKMLRVLSAVLAMVLMISILSACGGSKIANNTDVDDESQPYNIR